MKVRSQSLPWITGKLRHKMNLRYKLLKEAKRTGEEEVRSRYKKLRNKITQELRYAKSNYFANHFNKVRNTSEYWKVVKNATTYVVDSPPPALRRDDGSLAIDDTEKTELLN